MEERGDEARLSDQMGDGRTVGERTMGAGRNSALRYTTSCTLFNPLVQEKEDNEIVVFSWKIQLGGGERKREDIEEE